MPQVFPISLTGGVNRLVDSSQIQDNEWVSAQNLVPDTAQLVKKRPAGDRAVSILFSTNGLLLPLAGVIPPFESLAESVFVYRNIAQNVLAQIYVTDAGGNTLANSYFDPNPAAGTGVQIGGRPRLLSFNKKVYVFPGYPFQYAGKVVQQTASAASGVEIANFQLSGTNNDFPVSGACLYRGRFVYWGFGPGYENHILFADPYAPQTVGDNALAANGRALQVGALDGDKIVACVEITLTAVGSPAQSALLVLKRYSAYLISGEPNLTTDSDVTYTGIFGDLVVNRISFNCGCASADTIVTTPYGTVWASDDDVWLFAQGHVPVRIGSKIRPVLAQTPPGLRYLWTAAYYNGFYRLAVGSAGQAMSDDSALGEQWWLDLRDGAPERWQAAGWWGPQVYNIFRDNGVTAAAGTRVFVQETRPGRDNKLYSIEVFSDGNALSTYDIILFAYDSANAARDCLNTRNAALMQHTGTEILMDAKSKEFDFGDPMINKLYQGAELNVWNNETHQLAIDVLVDGGRQTDTNYESVNQSSFIAGVGAANTDTLTDEYKSLTVRPSATTRRAGKSLQFRIYERAGYVVSSDNDQFKFTHNSVTYTATLTQGYYATLSVFLDHLVARMLAASGITFTYSLATLLVAITAASGTWAPLFGSDTETKKVGSMLGYATQSTPSAGATKTAEDSVPTTRVADWAFGGLAVKIHAVSRRPL